MKKVSIITLCFLLIMTLATTSAHTSSNEDPTPQGRESGSNDLHRVNPFHYFADGELIPGAMFLVMWIGLIAGTIILFFLVLGRLFTGQ